MNLKDIGIYPQTKKGMVELFKDEYEEEQELIEIKEEEIKRNNKY